ncbi:MAG TPA: YbaL family putative K(+) efflux transporter [Rubrivivax sp.]|nr:YbaL family putative K(+) efflux transporter [Rubrivivax sp.]
MPHALSLITTLAAAFGLALVLGFIAVRLRLPALVGYLLAGIAIGPATPGFIADAAMAAQLAEIGVMLLMFGVGLHFSVSDLMSVRRIAVPGAVFQMLVATLMGTGVGLAWGWSIGGSLVFGLALSVASTVVLLKALEGQGMIDSANGRIAIGWLIVEDLAMVLVLVLLPALAPWFTGQGSSGDGPGAYATIAITLLQVVAFVAFMLIVGRRLFPWVLWHVTRTGSRELFTLCVVAAAVSIAYGSAQLFGVSFALGAFFAGMVLRESEFSQRAAEQTLPLQDAFAVLFFVSVGMLFDPAVLLEQPMRVLITVAIVLLGKSLAAGGLVLLFGYPVKTAIMVSASLAQIGEFSFILAGLGMALGLLSKEGHSLILAGAVISIALNPLLFSLAQPLERRLENTRFGRRRAPAESPLAELPASTEEKYLSRQVVLVGWGRVGKHIAQTLAAQGVPLIVAEENRELVERLRAGGTPAVWGDATDPAVLIQAHVREARALVIATPETVQVRRMIEVARTLNPGIEVLVRSHNAQEAELLRSEGAGKVFVGEDELGRAMVEHVLASVRGKPAV